MKNAAAKSPTKRIEVKPYERIVDNPADQSIDIPQEGGIVFMVVKSNSYVQFHEGWKIASL